MAHKNLLKGMKRPKSITIEHETSEKNFGRIIASPLERGYGTTLGNSLRRTLLSALQGYAVAAIRIEAYDPDKDTVRVISSEFEPVPGMLEDTIDFIINLKSVRVRLEDGVENRTVTVTAEGPGEFKAGELAVDDNIQINLGRGYVPAEANVEQIETIGTIPVDAIFSPVTKCNFRVENARVGQRGDYDKLILEVWTDGSIRPEDALADASKIMKDYLTHFINFNEEFQDEDHEVNEEAEKRRKILETPVEELELSVRSSNCLRNINVKTIGDLTHLTEEEISRTKNFGKKSLQEIKDKLSEYGLGLGMRDSHDQQQKRESES
jgi:DNA-directed RNA polymerase subunit alpha